MIKIVRRGKAMHPRREGRWLIRMGLRWSHNRREGGASDGIYVFN
jgi:hypothetical protein